MGGWSHFRDDCLIPVLRKSTFAQDQLTIFNKIENQFAQIARVMADLGWLKRDRYD
jgi:hypothetical protein